MIKFLHLLLAVSFLTIACSTPENQTEATSTTTTNSSSKSQQSKVKINLVTPNPQETVKMGNTQLVVEVIDSKTNQPVAVKDLDVQVSMPMEGEETMTSMVKIEPDSQPGRYKVKTNFSMQGKWDVVAKIKDSQRQGQASYTFNVK
ncbi:MAG: FixH family protein [Calothrix sp. MO_192.B10]|nr:FixH family protein [Calothrix sp. MO_192.B10]